MVKVLIYSSKEIHDNSSYEGRAEADIVAYRDDKGNYNIVKDRTYFTSRFYISSIYVDKNRAGRCISSTYRMKKYIEKAENDEWNREVEALKLQEKYKNHPLTELDKH